MLVTETMPFAAICHVSVQHLRRAPRKLEAEAAVEGTEGAMQLQGRDLGNSRRGALTGPVSGGGRGSINSSRLFAVLAIHRGGEGSLMMQVQDHTSKN